MASKTKSAFVWGIAAAMLSASGEVTFGQQTIDLADTTIVVRAGPLPKAEQTAARVLVEELEKRIGKRLPVSTAWPKEGSMIVLTSGSVDSLGGHAVPKRESSNRPESYRLFVEG